MKFRLSVLTLFRSPAKTIVTFVLLVATSFAFVSRGAEYATTVAEIGKAEAQYSAVGTLERSTEGYYEYMEDLLGEEVYEMENGGYVHRLSNASAPIDAEVVELVLASEHVAEDEVIMVAGGLTRDNENILDQPLYDLYDYGEWRGQMNGSFRLDVSFVKAPYVMTGEAISFGYHIKEVVVGSPEVIRAPEEPVINRMHINYWDSYPVDESAVATDWQEKDGKWFFWALGAYSYSNGDVLPYVDYPYINLTELEEKYGITDPIVALQDPETYGLVKFEHESGLPTASTLEYMETVYRNLHTNEMVHISEMGALHKYHEGELYIAEGRGIEATDTGLVCVVSADYAEKNGLSVGDTIEYTLGADTMVHSGKVFGREPPYPAVETYTDEHLKRAQRLVATASEQELTERGLDTVTQTYEIVGIWADPTYDVADPFSYSPNTVFVPASTYPWQGEVEPTMLPSTLSFTLNHPGDMAKIEAELGDRLAAMGYELSINDMGYAEAKPNFEFMKLSALIGFAAMSLALLLSLILTVYLYIIRKKHDYAIMRALGTTRSRSNNSLLVGLFALAIPAVFLGSLLALALTQGFAADLSAQISEITGNATASTMPAWLVGAFGAGVLGLLLVFARAGLVRVGRTPPLALLQGR